MTTEEEVDQFLAHYGVKGMKWGKRRKAKRAAAEKEYKKEVDKILKSIKGRSPSELYAVRSNQGNILMTGEEFVRRVDMGMRFSTINSTGQKINDGR